MASLVFLQLSPCHAPADEEVTCIVIIQWARQCPSHHSICSRSPEPPCCVSPQTASLFLQDVRFDSLMSRSEVGVWSPMTTLSGHSTPQQLQVDLQHEVTCCSRHVMKGLY